jgi:type VI secretion system protein ImpK
VHEGLKDVSNADETIALPSPGKRRGSAFSPQVDRQATAADISALGGLNPLVAAANSILAAVAQIRHSLTHPDPAGLRVQLLEQIAAFESAARAAKVPAERVASARYALCALLDDSAGSTPWGRDWIANGLVAEVEGEASGGDNFFPLLDSMLSKPADNIDLLEFFYLCLGLGFEGRYRSGEGGKPALEKVRAKLYEVIVKQHPQSEIYLSGHWEGVRKSAKRVQGALGLWLAASACALVLAGLYFGYSVALGTLSDPVARDIAQLRLAPSPEVAAVPAAAPAAAPTAPPAAAPAAAPTLPTITAAAPAPAPVAKPARVALSQQLADAIGRREVDVTEAGGASVIVLRSDGLFGSGSARLDAALTPVILRIAETLDAMPGGILVVGHTDDVPIRTARFPSNWELSTERANSVASLLATRLRDPARLRAEGVADSEPVAANDSAANRSRNRRVAIIVRTAL